MEKIYGVVTVRQVSSKNPSLNVTIPTEACEDLAIKKGDRFVVGMGKEGLTYQKRKE